MTKISKERKSAKSTKLPSFSRPPIAKEVFTRKTKAEFDELPGFLRHFVAQVIKTGSVDLAAERAGVQAKNIQEASAPGVRELLTQYKMGPEDIMVYLQSCIEAKGILRDKHGNLHETVNYNVRLQSLKLVLELMGAFSPKEKTKNMEKEIEDLFPDVEVKD